MKRAVALLVLLSLAACDVPLREATCSCFDAEGNATSNCDFEALPIDPSVYTLSTKSEPC